MSLIKIDDKGKAFDVKKVSNEKEYKERLGKFSAEETSSLKEHIPRKIELHEKFSVGTLFPRPWDDIIMIIYNTFQDEEQSKYFLGTLVKDIIINDKDKWICTGSDLHDRGYDSAFYWRDRND